MFINIGKKDNQTPLTPAEFNLLVNTLNNMILSDINDVATDPPVDGDVLTHDGAGWRPSDPKKVFYTKKEVEDLIKAGVDSSAVDKNYVHEQKDAETTWIVKHPLQKLVSVLVLDEGGTEIEGVVNLMGDDTVLITFNTPTKGKVILN